MKDKSILDTPDGRYIVVRGRLWRKTNPHLAEQVRKQLVSELMAARRAVKDADGIRNCWEEPAQPLMLRRSVWVSAALCGGWTGRRISTGTWQGRRGTRTGAATRVATFDAAAGHQKSIGQ